MNAPHDLSRELEIETLGVLGTRLGFLEDGGDATRPVVASIAQRVLRLTAVDNARVIAVFFDEEVPWPSTLADDLATTMRDSGTPATVTDAAQLDGVDSGQLALIPIAPDAPQATRLHALRVSDVAVLVVGIGTTKVRNVASLTTDANEMGARVVGAVLVPGAND